MAEAQTHVFRVSLSPKVYRDFEILSAKNLYDLAGELWQLDTRGPDFLELRNRLRDLLLGAATRRPPGRAVSARG